ncbi:MAG: enoyl-CoA hydratase-related protein [Thermaerobacter sp.]|nr:enoyl-CoA hydratase-related protein [Thermaerobacter sp.]
MAEVEIERIAGEAIAFLWINREPALNALNAEVMTALEKSWRILEQDDSVRVVAIFGRGSKAFVAGADIAAIHSLTDGDAAFRFSAEGQAIFQHIGQSRLVSMAAINGYALGGGLELAMALDMRIAADTARVGQPEINLGIVPGFGGTQRLARLVGAGQAMWMILSGEMMGAEEAFAAGLVDAVVPAAQLYDEVLRRARVLAAKAPLALREAKALVRGARDWPLSAGLAAEAESFRRIAGSADAREGTAAFLEKRTPHFRGA